ncbi:MAG: hypothetical protein JNJ54_14070 [Myxococcaceae bacterium]|nr:hypothetical protein [Myxococcaceae bacterium]
MTARTLPFALAALWLGCGPEVVVTDDEAATVSSELGVSYDAKPYGIERLRDQAGRELLVPTGMYLIGSRSGADNPDTNYWTKGGSSTHLKNSHGDVGPAYTMRTRQVNGSTIEFQVSVGPLPFPMNALSLSFDWDQARILRFKYQGSGFRDDCRPGTFRQTDVGYDELPQCHLIRDDRNVVVARAGAGKVYPASPWVEFTGDFEGRLRLTFTSLNGAVSSQFFNHSGSHAFGLEFAEGRSSTQGATYSASGLIELLPASAPTPTPTPTPSPAPGAGNTLATGATLSAGQALASTNGRFRAVMQSDGNFVVYEGSRATWSTQTAGRTGARAAMQGDGNFVLSVGATPIWSTRTNGRSGAVLTLKDDGALVVLQGGAAVWSSQSGSAPTPSPTPSPTPAPTPSTDVTQVKGGTTLAANTTVSSKNGRHRLVMQGDGNLVLYRDGAAAWATGTNGRAGVKAVMQTDGNFVAYQGTTPLFATGTNGRPGAVLELRDDGSLAVVLNGSELWRK